MFLSSLLVFPGKICFFLHKKYVLFFKPKTQTWRGPACCCWRWTALQLVSNYCCHEHGSHCYYQPETWKQKIKAEVTKWRRETLWFCDADEEWKTFFRFPRHNYQKCGPARTGHRRHKNTAQNISKNALRKNKRASAHKSHRHKSFNWGAWKLRWLNK